MEPDLASNGMRDQLKATIIDYIHSNYRHASWSIILVKQHTSIDFSTALDLIILP